MAGPSSSRADVRGGAGGETSFEGQADPVFGMPIKATDPEPPAVLAKLVRYLQARAFNMPDIFQKKPAFSEVSALRRRLAIEKASISLTSYAKDPHVVAEVLKQYLAALPEPVFTFAAYNSFVLVLTVVDAIDRISLLRVLLYSLPPGFQATALLLLDLLHRLHRDVLIDADKLAAIFGPCFLRPDQQLAFMTQDHLACCALLQLVIEHTDLIINPDSSKIAELAFAAPGKHQIPIPRFNAIARSVKQGVVVPSAELPPLYPQPTEPSAPPSPLPEGVVDELDPSPAEQPAEQDDELESVPYAEPSSSDLHTAGDDPEPQTVDDPEPHMVDHPELLPSELDDSMLSEDQFQPSAEPGTAAEPDTEEPETIDPETVEPDTIEPDTIEPDTIDPDTIEPDTVDIETGETSELPLSPPTQPAPHFSPASSSSSSSYHPLQDGNTVAILSCLSRVGDSVRAGCDPSRAISISKQLRDAKKVLVRTLNEVLGLEDDQLTHVHLVGEDVISGLDTGSNLGALLRVIFEALNEIASIIHQMDCVLSTDQVTQDAREEVFRCWHEVIALISDCAT